MNINIGRAVLAGAIGTAVMTAVGLWVASVMGPPPMNPAVMLAGAMGGSLALGWLAHFMIGITLAGSSGELRALFVNRYGEYGLLTSTRSWLHPKGDIQ